ncbi:DUF2971 domain-containing protein [Algoriphagus litoralis]|uniref:DUF2971 domain-containing protein n=1 Tax=Algoriphagus litoralis TaxID=2202829 RepID=UPI000DB9E4C6|nr:DUF2971 domain-containing protein [Algoriphagus litoralis]
MRLYKYHKIDKFLIWSLVNTENWYSRLKYLNDPYEAFFNDQTSTSIYKNFKETLCICSFSKTKDEILMWSHYADEHRGVCLEFLCPEDNNFKSSLIEINYNNKITKLDNVEITKDGHLSLNINSNGSWISQKLETWKYEQEIRRIIIEENTSIKGLSNKFPGKLSSIYFGVNANKFEIDLIKKITKDHNDLNYFKVELNETQNNMSSNHIV